MPQVKCRFCGKEIDKSVAYSPSSRLYFCSEKCYTNYKNKQKYKPNKDSDNPTIKQRRQLTDYIQQLFLQNGYKDDGDVPWSMLMSQTKNMVDDGLKYGGIYMTLKYMVEILDINVFDYSQGSILNLVPFYYNECKDFNIQKQTINKEISEQLDDFFDEPTKYITVNEKPKLSEKHKEYIGEL